MSGTDNATVIYYTSNREDPAFEEKIRNIIKVNSGGLPIVSVSQKPIDFGTNICVGDVGVSTHNMQRQFLMACMEATTKYVISAEADVLYPKSYFLWRPHKVMKCYRADSVYVLWQKGGTYRKKYASEGACIVDREFAIEKVTKQLEGRPMWDPAHVATPPSLGLFDKDDVARFHLHDPIVTLKTRNAYHSKTSYDKNREYLSLPIWGDPVSLRKMLGI